ncbi:flippase-like domain-containing protein [Pedobacter sp. BS3]|uniref:lysylphosphatidylglycerol synthase transmembrane domain-containing protein n=1 Tax=Pedobacter sp. BS3 TaxID=2567937 RepID=UPI0011ED511E|nr:lysylphosphatidylglycerol synthase transmembrane domain-containing protein [Pedobacter sp. BS3]TZF82103.1 flippase-like domain-containing protein [Pedobacter sp. BS3]
MDRQKLWSILKVVLKILFTGVLLYLVSLKIDFKEVKERFIKSDPFYIFLAFVFYYISQILASWRCLSLLKAIGLDLPFGFNFRLYLLGMFYNITLPGGVGGDGYKIYILRKKYKLPTKRIFLAMLFDRLSGLWAIGLLAVSLIILIPKIDIPQTWPIIALIAGTGIYYLVMKKFFPDYSRKFIQVHVKAGAVQLLQLFSVIAILLSQDFSGKFSPYLFSFLVSTLAANVPVSFAGVGAREYVMTHASSYFGMNQDLAVFLSMAFFLVSTFAALTGIWFVYRSKEFEPAPSQHEAEVFEKEADERIE